MRNFDGFQSFFLKNYCVLEKVVNNFCSTNSCAYFAEKIIENDGVAKKLFPFKVRGKLTKNGQFKPKNDIF